MALDKDMTGAAFQITFEMLSLFNRLERRVKSNLPGRKFGSVGTLPGIVVRNPLPKIGSMADVALARIAQALNRVGVEHGLPSIALKRAKNKSSFAQAYGGHPSH
jgi:hypothetical protein